MCIRDRYYKGKAFLPKAFKESNHIEEIQGVYVPFWLYDATADARGAYEGEVTESHQMCIRDRVWSIQTGSRA